MILILVCCGAGTECDSKRAKQRGHQCVSGNNVRCKNSNTPPGWYAHFGHCRSLLQFRTAVGVSTTKAVYTIRGKLRSRLLLSFYQYELWSKSSNCHVDASVEQFCVGFTRHSESEKMRCHRRNYALKSNGTFLFAMSRQASANV